MDFVMIVLRLVHIACGVFWAGTLIFFATFLEPALRDSGPNGGAVVQALLRRGYLTIVPIIAALTILSGFELLRRVSANFAAAWFQSGQGRALTAAATCALVAFGIGMLVMRPAVLRIGPLMQAAERDPAGPEKSTKLAQAQVLRRRTMIAGRLVAALLTLAVMGMAVARYVG